MQQSPRRPALLLPHHAGDRSVWDYWFQHFSPQYKGLPSLGSIEKIYNQADVSGKRLTWHAAWWLVCHPCSNQQLNFAQPDGF